jgi:hypothetical protein
VAGSDDDWSDAAFRRRDIAALLALDTPKWALKLFGVRDDEVAAAVGPVRLGPNSVADEKHQS